MKCPFTAGETYDLRGGETAFLYVTDAGGDYPIHGAVIVDGQRWSVAEWRANGRAAFGVVSPYDLIVPEPRASWIVLRRDDGVRLDGDFGRFWIFHSEDDAIRVAKTWGGVCVGQHELPEDWL